ncbi:hypothetical protein Tco_0698178 [Tanacetum coccineum]
MVPWKGVVRFGKKGKLAPRFVGPSKIIKKVGPIAYMLDLPKELDGVHDTFHMSNLKKCWPDPTLQVPLDEIQVDAKLNFVKEPVEILEESEFEGTDKAKITRKRSKPDKHEHGNGRARKEPGESYQKSRMSITSLKPLIGQYPTKDATWIVKKAQGMKLFTLESLSEEAQTCHNHGLPRWQSVCSKSNPTDEI